VATRKISDLTLLGADQVSSSDTLLLLDNSDPTDQNKRSAVGSIFTAVPSGTYTAPGVRFEGKTATGVFSETQGQVGLAMGNARLNLQKVGTTLNIQARDDADTNLDFTISAQGTGKIRLGSILAVNDLNFQIPNSIDETKVARFSVTNLTPGITNVYTFPDQAEITNNTDELLTLKSTQTMENKTIVSPQFTGALTMESFTSSGSATIGDAAADSLTVNAAATFAASTTFSNSVIMSQGATSSGSVTAPRVILNDDGNGGQLSVIEASQNDHTNYLFKYSNETYNTGGHGFGGWVGNDGTAYFRHNGNSEYRSIIFDQGDGPGPDGTRVLLELGAGGDVLLKYQGSTKLSTTTTGISIGGAIDAVTSITGSGDIAIATDKFTLASATGDAVFGGNITGGGDLNATTGTTFQLGSTSSAKLGIGRAASTYNLEVEGSIYSTGSTIIAGNGSAGKFILQKGAAAISMNFTNSVGTDEVIIDASGRFGVGKIPSKTMDVSGDAGFDGDITVVTTNPTLNTGGKISARELVLTDPSTGATTTLNAISGGGGLSRGKVYFLSN